MLNIEAILVTIIVAILFFPVLCAGVIITLLIEIINIIQEQITSDRYVKGIVTEVFVWYGSLLKRVYKEIVKGV